MQICIVGEALPGVVPRTIIGRSILVCHTTTCIALAAFKDVTLVSMHDIPVVPYAGELVIDMTSIETTTAATTYIQLVYTSLYIVGAVVRIVLYRETQVRGPPYRT